MDETKYETAARRVLLAKGGEPDAVDLWIASIRRRAFPGPDLREFKMDASPQQRAALRKSIETWIGDTEELIKLAKAYMKKHSTKKPRRRK